MRRGRSLWDQEIQFCSRVSVYLQGNEAPLFKSFTEIPTWRGQAAVGSTEIREIGGLTSVHTAGMRESCVCSHES